MRRDKSLQSCLTLCDPLDSSPPGSSVYGILQASSHLWHLSQCSDRCCKTYYWGPPGTCMVHVVGLELSSSMWRPKRFSK